MTDESRTNPLFHEESRVELVTRRSADVPVLLDQAEKALALVSTSEDAEDLWRKLTAVEHAARIVRAHTEVQLRAGRLKLRAERRWGELLGEAENTGVPVTTGDRLESRDKMARSRAREIAQVPEPVFDQYISTTKEPKRTRLLRVAREQREPEPLPIVTAMSEDMSIRHGDLRVTLDDLAGKVDAIVTDPPYPAEFLDEFDALGELATRLLKPNGLLVAMVGQTHLPEYITRLQAHLPYRWCAAYIMDGPAARVFGRKVGTKWKPLLIFGGNEFIVQDVFRSDADDKRHHHWGQSESGMADVVARLTKPGDLVVDPFVGGGTTALVCRELGRRFAGCDIDPKAVARTLERLAA